MSPIRDHRHPCWERLSVGLSIAPFVAPSDSFLSPKLGNKLSDQPIELLQTKPPIANTSAAATSIPQYSKDNLQRILKAVLEAQVPAPTPVPASTLTLAPAFAPTPAPAPAFIVSKAP